MQAEVTFASKQRDMLETKAEFRGAQRERNISLRKKTSIQAKITVSSLYNISVRIIQIALSDYQCPITHILYSRL